MSKLWLGQAEVPIAPNALYLVATRAVSPPNMKSVLFLSAVFTMALTACPKEKPEPKAQPHETNTKITATNTSPTHNKAVSEAERAQSEAVRAQAEHALEALNQHVRAGAMDHTNPWALAHGMVAFGAEHRSDNGRLAADVIVGDFLQKNAQTWFFPEKTAEGIPVEPHPHLMVKGLLEAGIPDHTTFRLKDGQEIKLRTLIEQLRSGFVVPQDAATWRNAAWTLSMLLKSYPLTEKLVLKNDSSMLKEVWLKALKALEEEQDFLLQLMDKNQPERVEKRKQGIYAHACGGFHFVQAVLLGAALSREPALMARAQRQLDVGLFRWRAERRIYQQQIAQHAKYRWILLVQELKFYGHLLETYALAAQWGLSTPSEETARALRGVSADLIRTIEALEPAYKAQAGIKTSTPQIYYDLIGDGCHAIRGLRLSLALLYPKVR